MRRPGTTTCGDLGFAACFGLTHWSVNISDMQAFYRRYLILKSCGDTSPSFTKEELRLGKVKITHSSSLSQKTWTASIWTQTCLAPNYNQTISPLAHAINSHPCLRSNVSFRKSWCLHRQHPIVLLCFPGDLELLLQPLLPLCHHHLSIHLSPPQEPMTN